MQACACQKLKTVKVEADISADPLWCAKCFANLDSDGFSLSSALRQDLFEWVRNYGTWIDWETEGVVVGGIALEAAHNTRGAELTELVKHELPQFDVVFSPSTYAARHGEV